VPAPSDAAERLIAEGNRAEDAGKLEEACALYREALRLAPHLARAHLNLGIALQALGDDDGAVARYQQALVLDPANPYAGYNFGKLRYERGAHGEAARLLRQALRSRPDFPEARVVLACALEAQGHMQAAATELEAVLRQRPDWAEALFNYGCVLNKLMRPAEAEAALRRTLAVDPGFTRAYRMLGSVLLAQCRIDEALELYRGAPRDPDLVSAELFALNASETAAEDELFVRHAEFGRGLEHAVAARFAFSNQKDPSRRLRIGYVSGDFSYHVVALFLLPVLERRDRAAVEVFCYATSERVDEYTRQLMAHADAWRPCAGLADTQVADAIHADGIDILVDLAGHSGEPQLRVFAQKPAPVQATWLGYLNTTGLTRIDYRISDAHADPAGLTDARHTEKLVRLPHSQWCYRPFMIAAAAASPPCLRQGHVTFGSFNQTLKLSQASRRLWAEILSRVAGSRLVVLGVPAGRARDELLSDMKKYGVDAARIDLVPYVSLQDYYGWYNAVDIALDPTPYSGGTTTFDALWMGVPVITSPGRRPSSRSAASILTSAGMTDWIVPSAEAYVRRAVQLSQDRILLANLRATLRPRLQASPLMDEAAFTKDLESLYRRLWRTYCAQGV
jgi:protein O-GlcNAc transferase